MVQKQFTFEDLPTMVGELSRKLDRVEALIENRNSPTDDPDQMLNIDQAAELLNLTKPTVYGLVSKRLIPVHKKSKRLYFSKQELIDWIRAGRKETLEEIQANAPANLKRKGGAL